MTTPTPTEDRRGFGRATLARHADGMGADEPLTFVASSQVINRYGYSLRTEGWRLDNFNANPVVLWMHNAFRPPIGAGRAIAKDGQVLLDAVTFDRDDELAALVEGKYRRGYLNAVSVGFDFVDENGDPVREGWWSMSPEKIRDEMFYDLAEVSAVSIPADPLALKQHARLALSRLGTELTALLDEHERTPSAAAATALPADQLEAAVRAEMARLGLPPNPTAPAVETTPPTPTPPTAVEIDDAAARRVLAAFDLGGRSA